MQIYRCIDRGVSRVFFNYGYAPLYQGFREGNYSAPSKNSASGEGGRAEYLMITKERLDLASSPYTPNKSLLNQAQKHTISNFSGAYAPSRFESYAHYAPRLDTPM